MAILLEKLADMEFHEPEILTVPASVPGCEY